MKVVYIAGPYMGATHDGKSFFQINTNIMFAREWAKKVFQLGVFAFCPHLNSYHMELDVDADADFWRKADLEILSRCDAILLIPGWENSRGSVLERTFAIDNSIPVFSSENELKDWLNGDVK